MDSYYTLTFQSIITQGMTITISDETPESVKASLDAELDLMNVFEDGDLEEGVSVYSRWSFWEEDRETGIDIYGRPYEVINEDVRSQLEAKLITAFILHYDLSRTPEE